MEEIDTLYTLQDGRYAHERWYIKRGKRKKNYRVMSLYRAAIFTIIH